MTCLPYLHSVGTFLLRSSDYYGASSPNLILHSNSIFETQSKRQEVGGVSWYAEENVVKFVETFTFDGESVLWL